jgi:hypothetical protein
MLVGHVRAYGNVPAAAAADFQRNRGPACPATMSIAVQRHVLLDAWSSSEHKTRGWWGQRFGEAQRT